MPSEEEIEDEEMLDDEAETEEIESKKNIMLERLLEEKKATDMEIGEDEHNEEEHNEEEHNEEEPEEEEDEEEEKIESKVQPKTLPQASYIMKLFDRSVNLAKFDEDTPLYPLCREWMKNQPRVQTINKNEKAQNPVIQTVEDGDVVEMPRIRIRKPKQVISRGENKLDIKNFDKIIDTEVWTKEKLLDFHRKQWNEEKTKQFETSRLFEEKHFTANLQLLDSLRKDDINE